MTRPVRHISHWLRGPIIGTLVLAALVAGLAVAASTAGSLTTERIVALLFINVILAVGMQTFIGFSGTVSLGHMSFVAIGAYVAALLSTPTATKLKSIPDAPPFLIDLTVSAIPAVAAAVLAAMIVAAIIGPIMVRLPVSAVPIATLAWMIVVSVLLSNATAVTRGDSIFYGIPRTTNIWIAAVFAVLALAVARCFRDSSMGLALRSSRKDELAASANGVNVVLVRYAAWVLSAGIVGAGGALYAQQLGAISPKLFLYEATFMLLAMVVIGGRSISGTAFGVVLVTIVVELLKRVENSVTIDGQGLFGLSSIGLGLIIIAAMVFRPDGLLSRWELDDLLARRRRQSPEPDSITAEKPTLTGERT